MGQELAGRGGPAAVSDPSMLDPSVHLGTIPTEDRPGWCLFMEHDPGVKGTRTPGLGEMAEIKRAPGNRGPSECGTTHEATSGMSS